MQSRSVDATQELIRPPRRAMALLSASLIIFMAMLSGFALWQAQEKARELSTPQQSYDAWFLSSLQAELERLNRAATQHDEQTVSVHLQILDGLLNTSPQSPQIVTQLLPRLPHAQALLAQLRTQLERWRGSDPETLQAELQSETGDQLDALYALELEAHIASTNQRDADRIELRRRFEFLSWVFGLLLLGCLWLVLRFYLGFRYATQLNAQLSELNRQLDARVRHKTRQLAEGHALLMFILDSSPSEVALVRASDNRVVLLNQRLLKRLKWDASPQHLPLHQLVLPNDDRAWFASELSGGGRIDSWQTQISAPQSYWATLWVQRVQVQGEPAHLLWMNDISEHKRLEADLRDLASTDALTGIANRRSLLERGEWMLKNCQRHGHPCALLMLDIDRFKRINDTFGHDVGDTAIRAVVRALRQHMRDTDLCGRLGGEEFAMILPLTPLQAATEVAERVRHAISNTPFDAGAPGQQYLTVSIGVACACAQRDSLPELLRAADQALYAAKSGGRNRVCVSPQAHNAGEGKNPPRGAPPIMPQAT